MKERMIRTQVYLPRDICIKLTKRANEEGISMAQQIQETLIQHIAETEAEIEGVPKYFIPSYDPIWNIVGMGKKDGPTDGSLHYDNYMYVSDWDSEENEL